ncbi:response regulator transcription factor [Chitinophaga rhizophila]|uniref:Helix-turn-helix transcriptional regulator n=1 Tax=Chitinophaga rhizophila TaxID=2866212 RepID=A0ABS7GM37_9BACT|nr:helix-turn-helix transcriptional regulator [Chitinophaga rhizophila]MBW8688355.1 helix-turn-helix transcriptional regulator [Chitinophaga rhizophila]
MKNYAQSGLFTRNNLGEIPAADRLKQNNYLEAVKAFARLTYESIYVIDYEHMTFEYVSENPLFLCGYSPEEVVKLGYEFYFRHVPENDLTMLNIINEAGFDFFKRVSDDDKMGYSITYDFHLADKDGGQLLINHKLTPLFLTSEGRLWKAMCIVSISHHKTAGNVCIYKQGAGDIWQLDLKNLAWTRSEKPKLNKREIEVLHLHAQGLTINQIAEKIFVAPDTVKYYRRRIFERLNVSNMVEALSYAVNNKII